MFDYEEQANESFYNEFRPEPPEAADETDGSTESDGVNDDIASTDKADNTAVDDACGESSEEAEPIYEYEEEGSPEADDEAIVTDVSDEVDAVPDSSVDDEDSQVIDIAEESEARTYSEDDNENAPVTSIADENEAWADASADNEDSPVSETTEVSEAGADPSVDTEAQPESQAATDAASESTEDSDTFKADSARENRQGPPDPTYEFEEDEVSVDDVFVDPDIPLTDDETTAYKVLKRAATLKGVSLQRDDFLRAVLSGRCEPDMVEAAIVSTPQAAGVGLDVVDTLADEAIALETSKVSALSMLAGLPGGLAAWGTIPVDLLQYLAHSIRLVQKLAYLYGWESLPNDLGEVDSQTMRRLILLLGVMMQVEDINVALAMHAHAAASEVNAQTGYTPDTDDTEWYLPIKKVLSAVGRRVTTNSVAEAFSRSIPMISGLLSGGLTYATFHPGAVGLKRYLRILPQATGTIPPADYLEAQVMQIEQQTKDEFDQALHAAFETAGVKAGEFAAQAGGVAEDLGVRASEVATAAAGQAQVVAQAAVDRVADYADAAKKRAGEAAKAAAIGFIKGLGTRKKKQDKRRGKQEEPAPTANPSKRDDVLEELRMLKLLLDEGILTQEEFDAKKRDLLGL